MEKNMNTNVTIHSFKFINALWVYLKNFSYYDWY